MESGDLVGEGGDDLLGGLLQGWLWVIARGTDTSFNRGTGISFVEMVDLLVLGL